MTFLMEHDGKTFAFHTEVGDGVTRPVFDEIAPAHPVAEQQQQLERDLNDHASE